MRIPVRFRTDISIFNEPAVYQMISFQLAFFENLDDYQKNYIKKAPNFLDALVLYRFLIVFTHQYDAIPAFQRPVCE